MRSSIINNDFTFYDAGFFLALNSTFITVRSSIIYDDDDVKSVSFYDAGFFHALNFTVRYIIINITSVRFFVALGFNNSSVSMKSLFHHGIEKHYAMVADNATLSMLTAIVKAKTLPVAEGFA
ncbi:hypothetical protein Q3G72_016652 [Acer saccharum]|nr:hypothetical protein Q3G72_016652 [Acer saccharum]